LQRIVIRVDGRGFLFDARQVRKNSPLLRVSKGRQGIASGIGAREVYRGVDVVGEKLLPRKRAYISRFDQPVARQFALHA
jgi:hypothetical protein